MGHYGNVYSPQYIHGKAHLLLRENKNMSFSNGSFLVRHVILIMEKQTCEIVKLFIIITLDLQPLQL